MSTLCERYVYNVFGYVILLARWLAVLYSHATPITNITKNPNYYMHAHHGVSKVGDTVTLLAFGLYCVI